MPFDRHRLAGKAANLRLRARMLQAVRSFFDADGYLEVETPHRIPAPIPEAHIDPEPTGDRVLHTSPEICMKPLVAAGYDRVFQICRCFRAAERGGRHLPEFTLLEWYTAGADYRDLMTQTEALIEHVARRIQRYPALEANRHPIDLTPPWPRLTVADAFLQFSPVPAERALAEGRFDEMLGLHVEPNLGRDTPVFLVDYPAPLAALARRKPGAPEVAERFELYIAGLELCNGFSELIDADEQSRRFAADRVARQRAGRPLWPLPEAFLEALASMPPAAGNALGIDRLVMLFAAADTIDSVVAFTPEELA